MGGILFHKPHARCARYTVDLSTCERLAFEWWRFVQIVFFIGFFFFFLSPLTSRNHARFVRETVSPLLLLLLLLLLHTALRDTGKSDVWCCTLHGVIRARWCWLGPDRTIVAEPRTLWFLCLRSRVDYPMPFPLAKWIIIMEKKKKHDIILLRWGVMLFADGLDKWNTRRRP